MHQSPERVYEPKPREPETQAGEITLPGKEFWEKHQGYVPEIWASQNTLDNYRGKVYVAHPPSRPGSKKIVTIITYDYPDLLTGQSYQIVEFGDQKMALPKFMSWKHCGHLAKRTSSSTSRMYREELAQSGLIRAKLTAEKGRPVLKPMEDRREEGSLQHH